MTTLFDCTSRNLLLRLTFVAGLLTGGAQLCVAQIQTQEVEVTSGVTTTILDKVNLNEGATIKNNISFGASDTYDFGTSASFARKLHSRSFRAASGAESGFGWELNSIYGALHWITANDGGGNLNIRFGNKYHEGAHIQTETGLALHLLWDNNDGQWHWKSTEISNGAGADIASQFAANEFLTISPMTRYWLYGQPDWTVQNKGTLDQDGPADFANDVGFQDRVDFNSSVYFNSGNPINIPTGKDFTIGAASGSTGVSSWTEVWHINGYTGSSAPVTYDVTLGSNAIFQITVSFGGYTTYYAVASHFVATVNGYMYSPGYFSGSTLSSGGHAGLSYTWINNSTLRLQFSNAATASSSTTGVARIEITRYDP